MVSKRKFNIKGVFAVNVCVFLLAIVMGYFFPDPAVFGLEILESKAEEISGLPWWGIMLYLIANNVRAALFLVFFGFIFLSVPLLFFNGYTIGAVISSSEIGVLNTILLLTPHGIFEIPAIILSVSLGVLVGSQWFRKPLDFRGVLRYSGSMFLRIIVPLVVLAGIIEGALIWILL